MKTTVHVLSSSREECTLCGVRIPEPGGHRAQAGEYVAVIDSLGGQTVYRIGSNNHDPLCNGAPASEFFQASVGIVRSGDHQGVPVAA